MRALVISGGGSKGVFVAAYADGIFHARLSSFCSDGVERQALEITNLGEKAWAKMKFFQKNECVPGIPGLSCTHQAYGG